MLANIKADLRTKIGGYDKRTKMESSIASVVVEGEAYEEELGRELEQTLAVHQLPVPAGGEEIIEIPDSQDPVAMEKTNVGRSQLWAGLSSQGSMVEEEGGYNWKDEDAEGESNLGK